MEIQGFDPRGKTFNFRLDAYSCYKRKTGFCSLDNISIDELKNCSSCVHVNGESTIEYCRGMAKLFLDHKFKTPADIYHDSICGHYCCDGGQHRTCVVAHLLKKVRMYH
jgi:hypothetical protein